MKGNPRLYFVKHMPWTKWSILNLRDVKNAQNNPILTTRDKLKPCIAKHMPWTEWSMLDRKGVKKKHAQSMHVTILKDKVGHYIAKHIP